MAFNPDMIQTAAQRSSLKLRNTQIHFAIIWLNISNEELKSTVIGLIHRERLIYAEWNTHSYNMLQIWLEDGDDDDDG